MRRCNHDTYRSSLNKLEYRRCDRGKGVQPAGTRDTSVWYRFTGSGNELDVSVCDFSGDLYSGLNLFVAEAGTCDTLACVSESTSGENDTCVKSRVPAGHSSHSAVQITFWK